VTVTVEDDVVMAKGFQRALADQELPLETRELARVKLGGAPYRVLGLLARGESSDVFLAERAHRATERVVLKVLRADDDASLLQHEWATLVRLRASEARGTEHFIDLLPRPIAHGAVVRSDGSRVPGLALGFPHGFVHTVEHVREAHPEGLDPRHAVWIWRRLLELLGFLHASGVAHGAVLPRHVLIHARDHGARLVGYSCADSAGAHLPGMVRADSAYYPEWARRDRRLCGSLDLAMSARVVLRALGQDAGVTRCPSRVPSPLGALLTNTAELVADASLSAPELLEQVTEAAREAFGAPRYVPLSMPHT